MARPTLLDLTQRILSAMDSDNVNSISDTIEAEQVADVIRETYLDIVDEYDLDSEHTIFALTASGTTARPTHMIIPEGYHSIEWVKYDTRKSGETQRKYTTIPYMEPDDFLDSTHQLNNDDSNVTLVTDLTGLEILVRNDVAPTAWTSFDATNIVFNSYDSGIDSTLQNSKVQVYGQKSQELTITDTAIIDLPHELYNLLRNQARETCFELFKDGAPIKLRQMAARSRVRAARLKDRNMQKDRESYDRLDYGRKRR